MKLCIALACLNFLAGQHPPHAAKPPKAQGQQTNEFLLCAAQPSAEKKFDTNPKHLLPISDHKAVDITKPVKVLILMGQSNRRGMGEVGTENTKGMLEYLTKTEQRYPHLVDDAGYKDDTPSGVEGEEKKPVPWYAGKPYDDDVGNAKKILSELGKYYPGAEKYEIAGFDWWQGHKDQNPAHASHYEQNRVHLIRTLREDLKTPKAPFVLATIGFDGWNLTGPGLTIANAQLAMNDGEKYPEFAGNVKCVEAGDFWRDVDVSPKNQGYHYNQNAETCIEVGNSLSWAMKDPVHK